MIAGIPPATIAIYEHHDVRSAGSVLTLPWVGSSEEEPSIVGLLADREVTNCAPCPGGSLCVAKLCESFSPGVPRPGTTRAGENVDWVSLLVFDIDHVTVAELNGVAERLGGLELVVSSTHSHLWGGPNDCCVRVVLPLQRPLNPTEWRHVHREVRRRYRLEWQRPGEDKLAGWDPVTKDVSRIYFFPTTSAGSTSLDIHQRGSLLDLDEILRSAPVAPISPGPTPRPSAPTLPPLNGAPVDVGVLRDALRKYNRQEDVGQTVTKKELARRVANGEPLTTLSEGRIRHITCVRAGRILAHTLPKDVPREVVLELVRPSVMGMPAFENDGERDGWCDSAFCKVLDAWSGAVKARIATEEKNRASRVATAERYKKLQGKRAPKATGREPTTEAQDQAAAETDEDADVDLSDEEWMESLKWKTHKDGSRAIISCLANAKRILICDEEWRDVLKYNEVTKNVEVTGGPLVAFENKPEQLATGISCWLQDEFDIILHTSVVMEAIVHVAKSRAYNPVKQYLESLKNDGIPRVDTFLEAYLGAETIELDDDKVFICDNTQLVRRISRYFLIGCVARGLDPGCKMDTVLILEGKQGIKKSTAVSILGGQWYTDSPAVIPSVAASMLAGRNWIVEMPELSAVRANETEAQKAFFSSPVDQFRPPYGRVVEDFPRGCVFVGTTNDDRYMNDITGNRRYLPVKCTFVRDRELRRDRDVIFAEAVEIYRAGFSCPKCKLPDRCAEHRWWLDEEENLLLEGVNNKRLKNDFAEAIEDHILKTPPAERPKVYTVFEVATKVLYLTADRVVSQQNGIGRALKALGFEKRRRRTGHSLSWVHHTPAELLAAPKRERSTHLHVVPKPESEAK